MDIVSPSRPVIVGLRHRATHSSAFAVIRINGDAVIPIT
jgi:hypothetical protein